MPDTARRGRHRAPLPAPPPPDGPWPGSWTALPLEIIGLKLAGLPMPDEVIDAAAETDPDQLTMQLATIAKWFAEHLARRGGLDLPAAWAEFAAAVAGPDKGDGFTADPHADLDPGENGPAGLTDDAYYAALAAGEREDGRG